MHLKSTVPCKILYCRSDNFKQVLRPPPGGFFYTRRTCSRSVVDCALSPQSHSRLCSWGFDCLSPGCNSNYLEYFFVVLAAAALLTALSHPSQIVDYAAGDSIACCFIHLYAPLFAIKVFLHFYSGISLALPNLSQVEARRWTIYCISR